MTNFLPPRRSIANFQADDVEGKTLFNGAANELEGFFVNPLVHDVATATPYIVGAATDTTEARVSHALAELWHLHAEFQKLIGESRQHGDDVPTMCHFARFVESGLVKADEAARKLASEMQHDRPFEAEPLAKEAFKNVLLECATLDRALQAEDAFSAFQEILRRQQHQAGNVFLQLNLSVPKNTENLTDVQKFPVFRRAVSHMYQHLQDTLGVAIPPSEVDRLIEHPIECALSTATLDDIRQQFFKLPAQAQGSFVSRILMPPQSVRFSLGG